MIDQTQNIKQLVLDQITDSNLNLLGITDLKVDPSFERFQKWLDENKHAEMNFLENYKEIRQNPSLLLENSKSAFVFGYQYDLKNKSKLEDKNFAKIAAYAHLKDYHKFLKKELSLLFDKVIEASADVFQYRALVDSAPVLERALAEKTKFGFIGKNTCYIHPKLGSAMLIAVVVTDLELSKDSKIEVKVDERSELGGCGSCKRCQVNCPTGALDEDYQLDARKCISYWTIEHRGVVATEHWYMFDEYVFGCDICQNVCPYNRKLETKKSKFEIEKFRNGVDLEFLACLSQEQYESHFGGTSITRAKRQGLQRNALIAMYQRKDLRLKNIVTNISQYSDHEAVLKTAEQIIERLN